MERIWETSCSKATVTGECRSGLVRRRQLSSTSEAASGSSKSTMTWSKRSSSSRATATSAALERPTATPNCDRTWVSVSAARSSLDTSSACNIMELNPSRFALYSRPASTANAELCCARISPRPVRIVRQLWQPSSWSFRHLLLPGPRCRLQRQFRRARALLRAVFQRLAGASRSAFPAVCTAPACGAKPHGYPSYIPLRLTLGLETAQVNGKALWDRYRSNWKAGGSRQRKAEIEVTRRKG